MLAWFVAVVCLVGRAAWVLVAELACNVPEDSAFTHQDCYPTRVSNDGEGLS